MRFELWERRGKVFFIQYSIVPKINNWTDPEVAYLAGFIDGDGSIFAQIAERKDYVLGFQIRYSITILQKHSRKFFLDQLEKELGCGTVRNRDNEQKMSELAIVGWQTIEPILRRLQPFLRLKRAQANLLLELIEQRAGAVKNPVRFLELCEKVDRFGELNDSRNRIITSKVVRDRLLELGLLE